MKPVPDWTQRKDALNTHEDIIQYSCASCGGGLEIDVQWKDEVRLEPCKQCMENAVQEAIAMKSVKIRGQQVRIDGDDVYITIHKPQADKFSLSDKLVEMVGQGFRINVSLGGATQVITEDTEILFAEHVVSKFPKCAGWQRMWYAIQ